jgi:hypothetical protein
MRLAAKDGYSLYKLELPSRALYVLAGPARFQWQHSISPVHGLRYSITLRTIKAEALRHATSGESNSTVQRNA